MGKRVGRSGFTLIELLVVVAIIALLIAILLPSLAKARILAKNTVCLANLKGLGRAYYVYCTEWDGNSIAYKSTTLSTGGHNSIRDAWAELMFPSSTPKDKRTTYNKLRTCPMATDRGLAGTTEHYGSADTSWNYIDGENDPGVTGVGANDFIIGSYGFNLDLLSDKPGFPTDVDGSSSWFVQSDAVGKIGAGDYPDMAVFADCIWRDFEGRNNDNPLHVTYYTTVTKTLHDGPVGATGTLASGQSGIERCNIDRHSKAINVAFKDGSARHVKLVDLWGLRWNLTNVPRPAASIRGPAPPEVFPAGY